MAKGIVKTFVDKSSPSGTLTIHVMDIPVAMRIRNYCQRHNFNCSRFVINAVMEKLDALETEELLQQYEKIPKEKLIEILVKSGIQIQITEDC